MESGKSAWIDVPEDWLDMEHSSNPEIARIQGFLGRNVREEVIRKHLLAEGIGKPGELEIKNIGSEIDARGSNEFTVKAMIQVEGVAWKKRDSVSGLFVEKYDPGLRKKDDVLFKRTFIKDQNGGIAGAYFDVLGVGKARLPGSFAREYYKRVIPFLRKLGVQYIETEPTTEADNPKREEGRFIGAYVWCRYGYKNKKMGETIEQFLKYLQDDRKISLMPEEIDDIRAINRMRRLALREIDKNGTIIKAGNDFLKGYDAKGKPTRGISWEGIIPNIHDDASPEMDELIKELLRK